MDQYGKNIHHRAPVLIFVLDNFVKFQKNLTSAQSDEMGPGYFGATDEKGPFSRFSNVSLEFNGPVWKKY